MEDLQKSLGVSDKDKLQSTTFNRINPLNFKNLKGKTIKLIYKIGDSYYAFYGICIKVTNKGLDSKIYLKNKYKVIFSYNIYNTQLQTLAVNDVELLKSNTK